MLPLFLVIDLFCGAGGTTTGFSMAGEYAKVIACVNHDKEAIKSHSANHPDVHHFTEDIRTLDLTELVQIVAYYRKLYPNAKLILWASLECTNFSKAKGGQPRDADSRTLADHLDRYVIALNPDYIMIENVVEFMSWGPLDANGKPISRKNGADWLRWRAMINSHGYNDEWRELNSANYGSFTSRNRLFGIFAKDGLPIAWPAPTHAKKPVENSLLGGTLKKWKAVKEVLDFSDEGNSIFDRKKPLSEKTLERIYAGLIKFVAGGKDAFMLKYNSTDAKGNHFPPSVEEPAPVITTQNRLGLIKPSFIQQRNAGNPEFRILSVNNPARTLTSTGGNLELVQAHFISKYFSGRPENKNISVEGPAGTIKTIDGQALVSSSFLANYYSGGGQLSGVDKPCGTICTKDTQALINTKYLLNYHHSSITNDITDPCPTLTCKDKLAIINPAFVYRDFTNGGSSSSIETPAGSILSNPKLNLVTAQPFIMGTSYDNSPNSIDEPARTLLASRKYSYLINPAWGGNNSNTENPCPVIVARQDKAPLYIVVSETGDVAIRLDEADSPCMIKIKEFMVLYGIVDIKMRMLRVDELLKIQGFPAGYILTGTQADQKKFIGNSVEPNVPKHMTIALAEKLSETLLKVA